MPDLDPCPHRPPCPGCPRYGERRIPPEARRVLERIAAARALPAPPVVEGSARGHRHRARLMVRGRARSPKVGIFQRGSHRIVDIPRCRVHHPLVNEVAAALKRSIRATGALPYADRPHRGDLRAVQVVVERQSQRAQIVLVGNADEPTRLLPLADALRADLGDAVHSLWWNGNPDRTNVILGSRWHRIAGDPFVRESIGGANVYFPPGAFGQSHLDLADRLVERVHGFVPDGAAVVEYHAGCGAIGLGLASRCRELRMNERGADAVRGMQRGLEDLAPAERARVQLRPGDAAEAGDLARDADVVVLDPPRRGIGERLMDALCAARPQRVVYVSCSPHSLDRDLTRLEAGAGLVLRGLEAFALFPWTEHVEAVALLEREPG